MTPPTPPGSPVKQSVTPLDHRIEVATALSTDVLWAYRDQGLLDDEVAELVDAHRELAAGVTDVVFHRTLISRLVSGEFEIDAALLNRLDRTVDQLKAAMTGRDRCADRVVALLEPLEQAARARNPAPAHVLEPADFAALLAMAQGAVLRENLLTQTRYVSTASGTRVPAATYHRLEDRGLVARDASHPLHAGQRVTVTETGRACLRDHGSSPRAASPATSSSVPFHGANRR
jgi:hypothetical protein